MTLHPKVIDLSLERLERLLAALGHPERALPPVIHIAGTNGKGSTGAFIRAGLEGTGARVHAYTSPHLARFHERIRLDGSLIDEAMLADLLAECEAANGGAPITFFEITTAAAFLAFSRVPADFLVLEVGLGGRLDATNVIPPPLATVITPVSLDHQSFLGDTLGAIAGEKAGILKTGVPCVVGPQDEEALRVIEARAAAIGAPLVVHGRDWDARFDQGRLAVQHGSGLDDLPPPALPGRHQAANAGAATMVLRLLGRAAGLDAAMTGVEWPARMQALREGPLVDAAPPGAELWLDGGHNAAAGEAIAAHLADLEERAPRPLHLICGMINTKDCAAFLMPFGGLARRVWAVTIPGEAMAVPAGDLADAARHAGLPASVSASVQEALSAIAREQGEAPRILICGSLYLAGRVLRDNSAAPAG